METISYFTSEFETISLEDLRKADHETQLDVMRTWFEQHFENPAEETPYDSAEGGYQWIWGGPFSADEELKNEFSGTIPEPVIDELIEELEGQSLEWAPVTTSEDYDQRLVNDIAQITTYRHNFLGAILNIEQLLDSDFDYKDYPVVCCLYRLLYVNVITALETYLSDAFISLVVTNPNLMRRFVETASEFRNEKITISKVYETMEGLDQKVKSYLGKLVWHRLKLIESMYYCTLGIKFPANYKKLFHDIETRHDIVHRNGKKKDGKEITLTKDEVKNLISEVESFINNIDEQVVKVKDNPNAPRSPFKVMT